MKFLIILLVMLSILQLLRVLSPYLLRWFLARLTKNMANQPRPQAPKKQPKPKEKVGEYIDFEEIE